MEQPFHRFEMNGELVRNAKEEPTMPVLFVGHGSPMNAIEANPFSQSWSEMGRILPEPSAILSISAHWETNGTFVTISENPKTIHDFYGFPEELFAMSYPAPGHPQLAENISASVTSTQMRPDESRGLDHGTWSVLKQMFPEARIPVVQISIDYNLKPNDHYLLGQQLKYLRRKGVLIMGSGNMVHNLRRIDWNKTDRGHDWAEEANAKLKQIILSGDYQKLTRYDQLGPAFQLSIPTPEHFLPLLYALALKEENETLSFFNDQCVYGSISMTSLMIKPIN